MRVAKTKALISFAVTAKLICAFVFAHADCWFSHVATQYRDVLTLSINCIKGILSFLNNLINALIKDSITT